MQAVFADWRTAPVPEGTRAVLGLIEQLAHDPDNVSVDAARAAGVSDDAIEDAIAVSATFHVVDRLADAFSFALPDEAGYAAGAKVLLRVGYAFPAMVWKLAARD